MHKQRIEKADGRYLIYYAFGQRLPPPEPLQLAKGAPGRRGTPVAPQLRWNPVLEQWVVVAAHRQERTFLPAEESCPFCPTRGPQFATEIPAPDFEVVAFENRFPSFVPHPPSLTGSEGLYQARAAQGVCEVVVYTPEHHSSLAQQSLEQVHNVVEVWADRFQELGALSFVRYVFIFENKGEVVGVTLHHPHGQIYALPYVPPVVERELRSSQLHRQRTGQCLFCHILEREVEERTRLVLEGQAHVAFIPFYAQWPYEVHLLPKRHVASIAEMTGNERRDLAGILKAVLMKYDSLFGLPFPYVMVMHQRPTDGGDYGHYHFHIEFYPPHRTRERLKYLAGIELGAGTFLNDAYPEERALELREAGPHTEKQNGDSF